MTARLDVGPVDPELDLRAKRHRQREAEAYDGGMPDADYFDGPDPTDDGPPIPDANDGPPPEMDDGPELDPRPSARVRVPEAWRSQLVTKRIPKKDGGSFEVTAPIAANVATILRFHEEWLGGIAYDAFREAQVSTRPPPWHPIDAPAQIRVGEWTDEDTARACNWLARRENLQVGPKLVEQALSVVAGAKVVHPVRDYLHSLAWDGVPRLGAMLSTHFGTADTPYERGVGSRWMISCVARIEQPGCQVDCTLLLEGPQGIGKTSAFRALVRDPSWYADSGLDVGNKDSFDALRAVWIYGLDELDSLKRGDLTRWKNFLTQTRDHYRASYAKRARDYVRQTVFCGTTNEHTYFTDRTGNRRFLPVKVLRPIDAGAIRRDRDQLWAEALHRYRAGEPWHVDTAEFRALCADEQSDRVQVDPWQSLVGAWLKKPTVTLWEEGDYGKRTKTLWPYDATHGVLTEDVLVHGLEMRRDAVTNAASQRMAEVLRSLGYERGPLRREATGQRVRRFVAKVSPGVGAGNPVPDLDPDPVTP